MKILTAVVALLLCRPAAAGELKSFTLVSNGIKRSYSVYQPELPTSGRRLPLIVLLHGGGGTGAGMRRLTRKGLETLADSRGALVAYPEAVEKHWNDYRDDKVRKPKRRNVDDVAFLTEMTRAIEQEYPVDPARIYAAGMSNGAMMAYALACRAADRFAAVAAVAGGVPEPLYSACKPSRPVAVLIINGTADSLVHWEGGEVTGPFGKRKFGRAVSAIKSRDLWLKLDSCDRERKGVDRFDSDKADGTVIFAETYVSCAAQSEVKFVKIVGGGHTWPGGLQYLPKGVIGKVSAEVDASSEAFYFFMRHSLPPAGDAQPPGGEAAVPPPISEDSD